MDTKSQRKPRPMAMLIFMFVGTLVVCELLYRRVVERVEEGKTVHMLGPVRSTLARYERARWHLLTHPLGYGFLFTLGAPLGYLGFRRVSRRLHEWREVRAGMRHPGRDYHLENPFDRSREGATRAATNEMVWALRDERPEDERVVLGFDERKRPIYLTDRARSMHVHLIGQTGSGKTRSVIHPLLFQDIRRPYLSPSGGSHRRSILFVDGKGAADNEEILCQFAEANGRRDDVRIFTLNPRFESHTYNPLYMTADADPRAVAERVFSTFEPDMGEPYYRDMTRELFVNLVSALASIGKQMCMLDVLACVSDKRILLHALELASDKPAIWRIKNRITKLDDKFDQTYSSLIAALSRYDHPAVNAYNPDIVLERDLEAGKIIGFSLPANAYKFLARAIGLIVFQHLQHVGAMRQMGALGARVPISVFADEFYTFAYEGFTDAVNKLRDANISLLLSHQSLSDLERVSPEYARGIWDNTRNKIMLYSNDDALCERLATSVGTRRDTQLTVRRAADSYLNQVSMLEASSREVDEFILHPNQLKNLRTGQAYLVQAGIADETPPRRWYQRRSATPAVRVTGTNLALLPPLRECRRPSPGTAQTEQGLHLYDEFVKEFTSDR